MYPALKRRATQKRSLFQQTMKEVPDMNKEFPAELGSTHGR